MSYNKERQILEVAAFRLFRGKKEMKNVMQNITL